MKQKAKFKKGTKALAARLAKTATRAPELRRLQSVLLGCKGFPAKEVSQITGLTIGYIRQIWMKCREEGVESLAGEKRGRSRGKAHLSLSEEAAFLNPFKKKAESGQLVTANEIRKAHAEKVGKELSPTVTYRLLGRHRWRKIAPRPEHPKHKTEDLKRFREAIFPPDVDPYED